MTMKPFPNNSLLLLGPMFWLLVISLSPGFLNQVHLKSLQTIQDNRHLRPYRYHHIIHTRTDLAGSKAN